MNCARLAFAVLMVVGLCAGVAQAANGAQAGGVIYGKDNAPKAPKLEDLPLKESVSQYGITWTFEKAARVGQFVNGDFYVVGPVTVTAIDPKPLFGAEVPAEELDKGQKPQDALRNGSMLNPPPSTRRPWTAAAQTRTGTHPRWPPGCPSA